MNARVTLGISAAGVLTFGLALLGQGQSLAQEPTSSPAPVASPAMGMPSGSMVMDPSDMGAMMGEAMGHMMDHMMSMGASPRGMGGDWQRGAHEWDHASHGMMGTPSFDDPHEACLDRMDDMATMMESMMSGSSGMGMGPGMDGGMSMGGASPAPAASPVASPAVDAVDHAAHHPAASASPGV